MATYTLISSNVLSSSAASVTFSSIPSTYTDLVLRWSARDDNADVYSIPRISFNSDSASNYSRTQLEGYGAGGSASGNAANQSFIAAFYTFDGNTATSNTFSNSELYIPNYTSTNSRQLSIFGVSETSSSSAYMSATAALYRGSSSISSITITKGGFASNILAGSSFYLYGISNA